MQTKAQRYSQHLIREIFGAYGTPPRLASEEARHACENYVIDAECAGDNPAEECRNYVKWVKYALKHRRDEHPPHSPEKACTEIATYAGKACAWSKGKREKATLFQPRPNPHIRQPDDYQKPTLPEMRQFIADLKQTLSDGMDDEIRARYGLKRRIREPEPAT